MRAIDEQRMLVRITSFCMQKLGNEPSEYEDSIYYDLEKRKFAVADGASECCFAKIWAAILTEFFVKSDLSLFSFENLSADVTEKAFLSFLFIVQQEWNNRVDWANLPWNVLEKAKKGAFATFLGLEIGENHGKGKNLYGWQAIAVGDCCLFRMKNEKLIDLFPICDSAQFGSMPSMLSSVPSPNASDQYEVDSLEGKIESGDTIILATDAVAKWIIQESEAGRDVCKDLVSLESGELKSYFEGLIESGKMKNDDITVLILSF